MDTKTDRALLAVAALLLFLSFGCISQGEAGTRSIWVWGWKGLAGIALATVVGLLAVGYMAAILLNDDRLKAWIKKEAGQALYSAAIFLFAILLVDSIDPMLKSASTILATPEWSSYVNNMVCCEGGPENGCLGVGRHRACHIELASEYLQILYETLRSSAASFLNNYWMYAFLSNLSVGLSPLLDTRGPSLSVSPFVALSMTADYFSILFDLALKMMMLVRAQQIILDFTWYAFFPIFMSMGLVLRMLYFTRKLGGLLVALALGAYIVLPMFYVVCGAILFGFMGNPVGGMQNFGYTFNEDASAGGTPMPMVAPGDSLDWGTATDANKEFTGNQYVEGKTINIDLCNEDENARNQMNVLAQDFVSKWESGEYGNTPWYKQAWSFIKGVPEGLADGVNAFGDKGPVASLAMIMVFTLVLPFFGIMTTLAAVKVFSPLIGGDVEISVLSKLI